MRSIIAVNKNLDAPKLNLLAPFDLSTGLKRRGEWKENSVILKKKKRKEKKRMIPFENH